MACFIKQKNQTIADCIFAKKFNFFKYGLQQNCSEYCPLECDSIQYHITNSIVLKGSSG